MTSTNTLIRQGRNDEIWTKYCGFFDLNLDEFMKIQERLLMEQIELLGKSMMGRMVMGEMIPKNMEEFRQVVPLTTYEDYVGYLDQKREDVLPRKPHGWSHTSGRSGKYKYKWVPYPKKMYDKLGEILIATMILSTCSTKGEVNLELNDKVLLATAPPPYVTSFLSHSLGEQIAVKFLPSLEIGEKMDFKERINEGFKLAMKDGLDYFYGIASVLVGIGERFEKGSGQIDFSFDMLHPSVIWRLIKGFVSTKIKNQPTLPKDIWNLKGIMVGGTDTEIYRDKIIHYWGKDPINGYGSTEGGAMSVQAWNRKGMTFSPETNFLEFIPHQEHIKSKENPEYQPKTLLYSELEPGIYELVFTNFHGGIFTRYRVGDLIEVLSRKDEEVGIDLPQFKFYSRADDTIRLAGFSILTEKDIWTAIEGSGIEYFDWVARKEIKESKAYLHLFIELKNRDGIDRDTIRDGIRKNLRKNNSDYADLENMLDYDALRLTFLNPGSFGSYMDYQKSQGADLAHTKPPHMKPSKEQMKSLMQKERIKD